MHDNKKLKLVLCWHMHQPEYRDLETKEFKLPWTYLHVIKDYVDMVAHLEAVPNAKVVVNFAPILLEQIEDYANQVSCFLHDGAHIRDPLLAALAGPSIPSDPEQRLKLVRECMRANRGRQINRYPQFAKLANIIEWVEANPDAMKYMSSQFIVDVLMWYHLAWMGETVKRDDLRIKCFLEKGANFTLHERGEMIEVIGELLASVLHRYKTLAEKGQIELSVTPYAHPIVPLLLDINSTKQAMPDAPLPELDNYPDGENRVHWHINKGLETFERFFGFKPTGCWPSEGGVCKNTLKVMGDSGFNWVATGGSVLHNSINHTPIESGGIYHPFKLEEDGIACFFRDDGLSDLIGFEYSTWHADDAVGDLIHHLENIATHEEEGSVVSIIMDGENAWEHFPENGYYFLRALYEQLASHSSIEMTTYSECLQQQTQVKTLPNLVPGSWVYGTFSTWIGDRDTNRAWDMLGDVKKCFDQVIANESLSPEQLELAEMQLGVCEGSDWFWWFGDYNSAEAVSSFEQQYRLNLSNLYRLLGEEVPAYLSLTFTQGSGDPAMGGTMRQGTEA